MNPQVPVRALQHKNGKFYQVEFTVLMEKCTALLCSETIQEMDLIQVRFENILSLELALEQTPLTKESLVTMFRLYLTALTTWKSNRMPSLLYIRRRKFQ